MISSNQTADQEKQVENNITNTASANQSNESIPQSLSPAMIAQVMERGQVQPQQQSSKQNQNLYPQYDWDNKWLKGDEYANMLEKIEEYCKLYNLEKFAKKTHPEDIYRAPQNGLIYFVEGNCVGSEFGFPRVPFRKQYRWKKMNFTTDLPKKRPQVTYIVASSVKCQKSSGNDKSKQDNNKKDQDVYRMHAVILYKNSQAKQQQQQQLQAQENSNNNNNIEGISNIITPKGSENKQYILCHIRKMDINDEDRIHSNRVGTNNNSSASPESSQDLIANSNSRSGKVNKAVQMKKLSISDNRQYPDDEEEDDEDESDEIDEMEDEVKENQRINKRKSSSIYEKSSNHDSQGNQIQTLHPRDTNKQSKAKSKLSNKQQSKQSENFQKSQFNLNSKQGTVSVDVSPEQPTAFLQLKVSNKGEQSGSAQQGYQEGQSQLNSVIMDNINKKTKVDEGFSQGQILSFFNQFKGSESNLMLNQNNQQQALNNLQKMNQLHQSPNNQRQRSPGNCEVNSITSSTNTNQLKEEDINGHSQQQKQGLISQGTINASSIQIPQMSLTGINNMFQNQLYPSQGGIPYQGYQGGMMMLQPIPQLQTTPYNIPQIQLMQMCLNSSLFATPSEIISLQQQQQQQQPQNFLMQQSANLYNFLRAPQVNNDALNYYLQNSATNSDHDYRNIYSMQMNSNIQANSNFIPNQRNQNAP